MLRCIAAASLLAACSPPVCPPVPTIPTASAQMCARQASYTCHVGIDTYEAKTKVVRASPPERLLILERAGVAIGVNLDAAAQLVPGVRHVQGFLADHPYGPATLRIDDSEANRAENVVVFERLHGFLVQELRAGRFSLAVDGKQHDAVIIQLFGHQCPSGKCGNGGEQFLSPTCERVLIGVGWVS